MTIAPRARSGAEPPAPAAAAMAAADVVLCAASTSLYHTTAKAAAQRAGARGDFNAPYRADAWRNGAMTADFFAIRERAERAGRAVAADARGPDHLPGRHGSASDGDGARADGLADRDLPQPGRGVGAARRRGVAAAARGDRRGRRRLGAGRVGPRRARRPGHDHGPRRSRGRRSRAAPRPPGSATIVATVRDADNIGEIGIGLNPAARIGDEITEAKKAFGTVHIALGDSANEYGGLVECDVHLDGLVMSPTIEFDGVAGRRRRTARLRRPP